MLDGGVGPPRLGPKRHCGSLLSSLGSQLPCLEDTGAALRREAHVGRLRERPGKCVFQPSDGDRRPSQHLAFTVGRDPEPELPGQAALKFPAQGRLGGSVG